MKFEGESSSEHKNHEERITENNNLLSRRKMLASLGLVGLAVAADGLVPTLRAQATPNPNQNADHSYYRYSDKQPQRTVGEMFRDWINVKDFGAAGDGVTDNTAIFLEAEIEANGRPIFVPVGNYRADSADLKGLYFGEGATLIVRERETFYNATPPSERTRQRIVYLSNTPHPILNEFYGRNSGKNAQLESYTNTAVGEDSLKNIRTGKQNTAIGFQSQSQHETEYSNVSVGADSLSKGKKFSRSVAIGSNAMKWAGIQDPIETRHELWLNEKDEQDVWNIEGSPSYFMKEMNPNVGELIKPGGYFPAAERAEDVYANTAVGRNALLQLVKGSYNVALGYQALSRSYTTEESVALGAYALATSLAGRGNVAVGKESMRYNQSGFGNVSIGYRALANEVFGTRNTVIGYNAGRNMRGNSAASNTLNILLGSYAGEHKTDGMANIVIGARALLHGGTGSKNIVIGTEAAMNYTGSNSIIIGNKATPTTQASRVLWVDYGNDGKPSPFIYGDMNNDLINMRADVRPDTDHTRNLGHPSRRWNDIYATNSMIQTSDKNKKQQISSIPDKWLDAWEEVEYSRYKYNDAVKEKGNKARWHVGIIAQDIHDAFAKHGIDAFEIGLLCMDEWEEEVENILDEQGKPTGKKRVIIEAGSQWGIRAEECQFLEMALQRRETKRLKEELAKLKELVNT